MYQMGILLQYNKDISYTFEELKLKTDLNDLVLKATLGTLIQAKVLKLVISAEALYDTSKKVHINLKVLYLIQYEQKEKKIQEELQKGLMKTIKEILHAIIKILRCNKTMNIADLAKEAIERVEKLCHFKPTLADIKKCIDILLETKHIEYQEGEKN
ncbi:3834_t:CDS:2, partial [Racocetra fulgida]